MFKISKHELLFSIFIPALAFIFIFGGTLFFWGHLVWHESFKEYLTWLPIISLLSGTIVATIVALLLYVVYTLSLKSKILLYTFSYIDAALGATFDAVLFCDHRGRVFKFNENFPVLMSIPAKDIELKHMQDVMKLIASQTQNPEIFLEKFNQIVKNNSPEVFDEVIYRDGRTFEYCAHTKKLADKIYARVFSFRDVSFRKKMEQELLYQSLHDNVTGLPNRTLLMDRLTQAIAHAHHDKYSIAVIFFDVDDFKSINTHIGEHKANQLLAKLALNLQEIMEATDTIASLGGDKFIVIKEFTDIETISRFIKECQNFSNNIVIDGNELHFTLSVGISVAPKDSDDSKKIISQSEIALYHAKRAGRGHVEFFHEDMTSGTSRRLQIAEELRKAINNGELNLHYQPVMNVQTKKVLSLEVLLRWKNEKLGNVSPGEFITIAEETGLIMQMGEYVLRRACQQFKEWQKLGIHFPKLSINLSAKEFKHPDLARHIHGILQEAYVEPRHLEVEITENVFMQNDAVILQNMNALKKIGVSLALDDFGIGFSSLAYLKRFPVDKLKIDKTFIQDIEHAHDDRQIIAAIIAMAKALDLIVVTEGVETEKQLQILQSLHCLYIQGYYFSRPLSAEDCTQYLLTH